MSIFDEERKRLGLPAMSEASSVSDFFAKERQRIQSGQKTRYQEILDRNVDNARFAGRAQIDDSKFYQKEQGKKKSSKKSKKSVLQKAGDFITSKDVDNDGERDGLLGMIDRFVLPISKGATDSFIPGNTERMAMNDPDNPVVKAAQKDRGLETDILNTLGMFGALAAPYSQGYKAANFALNRVGALSKVTNPYAQRAITGAAAGGLTEAGISATNELANSEAYNMKDYALRTGLGMVGGAVLDPALYGAGRLVSQGLENSAARTMRGLLPDNQQVARGLVDNFRLTQADNVPVRDFPNMSNTPVPGTLNDLMPKASDLTSPNYVRPLNDFQTPRMEVQSPKLEVKPFSQVDSLPDSPQTGAPKVEPVKMETPQVEMPKPMESQPAANPSNVVRMPNERKFYNTVANSEKTNPEMLERLEKFEKEYTPMSNKDTVDFANEYVKADPEKAFQFVKNAKKFDPRHITVGHRLIDEFQAKGQFDRALDVVERLAEQGTKAGQSIQAYSIYNRLTPQGQLLRAQRKVNQLNENIIRSGKKVVLTDGVAAKITESVDSIQRLTGQEDISKNVIALMEKVKKGTALTDAELKTVRSFISDAKKFIGDVTPKAERAKPKPVKDSRTRDKVVDFMSKQEEVARKRLRERMNRANSLPVDVFYDLSIIGASKIAKGTIKFADFAETMVKEFGEEIRPYMRQIYDKATETFNLQSESMTSKRLSQMEKIVNKAVKDKNLTEDQASDIQSYLNDYLRLTGDAKLEASMELQATLQLLERPTFARQISTAQTIAQLLNPKTIVRNAIGNELFYRVEQINKLVATPIDIAKSKLTGSSRTVTFRANNQGQYWRNFFVGAKAGWRGVNPAGLNTAYDLGPQAFRSKWNPMTYLEKTLGATLRSFDYAGYMRAYNKTIGELATLKAVNEGLKGRAAREAIKQYVREADENMVHIADSYGKYATFQDHTVLSNALTKVKKGANRLSTLGATNEFGLGDLILKYPKTPGNLIMRAIEYSPAGLIRSAYLLKDLKKVKSFENERSFYLSLTRAITGTGGFSLLGYVLADKGILTSSGHSDYEVKNLERIAGKQPNSVNVTALQRFISSGLKLEEATTKEGDTFISYDWAQPISLAIALGTGVSQSVKEEDELDTGKAAKAGFDSAYNTIIEQSVLRGLNDFLASYPGRTLSDRLTDAGKNIASSFVPTLSNQISQIGDNTARNSYSPDVLEEMKNRSINRIPNLDSTLPPAYDSLGNMRQTFQDGSNNAFNVFLNPSFVSRYKPSPEAKFVLDFINETGEKTVAPRTPRKYLTIDGEKVDLSGSQYSEMQRILGEETRKGLEKAVPKLQGETEFEKIRSELEKVLNKAGDKARKEMKQQVGE